MKYSCARGVSLRRKLVSVSFLTVLAVCTCVPAARAQSTTERLKDKSNSNNCIEAASLPGLGMLFPLGPELNVTTSGKVGIGTTQPTHKLTVNGTLFSLSGGFLFADGGTLATATPTGSQGPQGPVGPQGPDGPQGDPGVTAINGAGSSVTPVTMLGSGIASVSTSGNDVRVNISSPSCTYENVTYSVGQRCYFGPQFCSGGLQGDFLTCQADGSWVKGTLFCTSNFPMNQTCGN